MGPKEILSTGPAVSNYVPIHRYRRTSLFLLGYLDRTLPWPNSVGKLPDYLIILEETEQRLGLQMGEEFIPDG